MSDLLGCGRRIGFGFGVCTPGCGAFVGFNAGSMPGG